MIIEASIKDLKNYQLTPKDRFVKLNAYQDRFIFSTARYLAMMAAWGTGKTMCGIEVAMMESQKYRNNLGVIFRKEFTDLRDSTIKDFEIYTGIKLNSSRDAKVGSSTIMFRHLEEINNIQNINLGWFLIEQGEELDSDDNFFKLHGRLRRCHGCVKQINPDSGNPECVCGHRGVVIANTKGHNWMYKLWKAKRLPNYELIEAKTWDNAHNLPRKFIDDMKALRDQKPKIYNRFVENSYDEGDLEARVISPDKIRAAKERFVNNRNVPIRRCVGVDVAAGGRDKTVMYALENGAILGKLVIDKSDTMETVGIVTLFAKQHKDIKNIAVDEIGVGKGVADRLKELGYNVIYVDSRESSSDPKFKNRRSEVWGYGSEQFDNGSISFYGIVDDDLTEQLAWPQWKKIDSNSVMQVEPKEDIIERYGRSPDNADAYLYALWGMSKTKQIYVDHSKQTVGWSGGAYVPERMSA